MRIAIFYHVYVSGGEIPTSFDTAIRIAYEQLDTLNVVGLREAADHIHIGVSGSESDVAAIKSLLPTSQFVVQRNESGVGELPTMKSMQEWCENQLDWNVLYFHTKGAIHLGNPKAERWRRCMEDAVLWRWRDCVKALESGDYDSAGAHWLKPYIYPFIGKTPYWGGNFWWATSKFINTLPPINVNLSRYEAEVWIGRGPRMPRALDLKRHFPMQGC